MKAKFIFDKKELEEWIDAKLSECTQYFLLDTSTIKAVDTQEGTSTEAFEIHVEI